MSEREQWAGSSEHPAEYSAASAGALLREARLAAGVHIESIAFSLKVPVSKIEALERDDFEALPDAVFTRALAGSVCRSLKIDSARVLSLLPQGAAQRAPTQYTPEPSFRDGFERSRGGVGRLSRPLVLAVILLLAGAGVLAWFPSISKWTEGLSEGWNRTQSANLPASSPVDVAVLTASPAAPEPTAPLVPPLPFSVPASPPAVNSASPSDARADERPGPTTSAMPRVAFKARGESWIQVKDGQGMVVLERTLKPGETASVNQAGRLAVVVGRADATDVFVLGEKHDTLASARENVARFEVKP